MMKTILALIIGITMHFTPKPASIAGQSRYAITDMGNPAAAHYTETTPRTPWDMQIHQGKLYIGAGDYNANSGNTPIYALDLQTQIWEDTGDVLDESVASFVILGDTLYIPGIDPTTGSWAYGNYYHQEGQQWKIHDNIPNAVHNFDIVRYNEHLFFGIGTANATVSPVQISKDNGETYQNVAFYRDGKNQIGDQTYSYFRVYNFFQLKGDSYCLFAAIKKDNTRETGFYRYTGEYFQRLDGTGMNRSNLWQMLIGESVTLKDRCYLATGHFYQTEDFHTYTEIVFPEQDYVTDFVTAGDFIYVLTAKKVQNETYLNTLWRFIPETEAQIRITSFQTEGGFGLSLEKNGASFYVGLGHGSDAGRILKITPNGFFTRLFSLLLPDKSDPILPEDWS